MMEKLLYLLKDREYTITEDNNIVLSYPQKDPQYKYEIVIEILEGKSLFYIQYNVIKYTNLQ